MICYINRSTVDYDIRLQKYVQACIDTNTPYCVIGWDRVRNCSKVYPNEYQYRAYSPYGNGLRSFFPLLGWAFFVLYHLFRQRKSYKVIHACNIENYLVAYPAKLFGKKLVLDIYDSIESKIETEVAKACDALILPSTHRLEEINVCRSELKKYLEVENVPVFRTNINKKGEIEFPNIIHLSYVGVLQRRIRGIENLLSLVDKDQRFILDIAGIGDGLDDEIIELSRINKRIRYYGKVDYNTALQIMNGSNFIVALYYLSCRAHKYASPNKYYESLFLSKPVITSKGTLVGNSVLQYNTGYVIDDTKEALQKLFSQVNTEMFKNDYIEKKRNCAHRWKNVYSSYFDKVTKGDYIQLMKSL